MAQGTEEYQFDPWATSTGLPDRITVRFDNPHFGTDAQINNGMTCLFVAEGTIVAGTEDGGAAEFNQFYSCGDGWEPASKGTRVVREDGKPKQFNGNSNYGRLFASLMETAREQGLEDELRKKGTPYDASAWQGVEAYMERVDLPSFIGRDGNKVERQLLVVKRIESLGGGKKAKAAPAKTEEAGEEVQESSTVGESAASTNGEVAIDAKMKAKLRALARECESHQQFVERGLDMDGVLDDPALEQAVMDAGAESIWASVQG